MLYVNSTIFNNLIKFGRPYEPDFCAFLHKLACAIYLCIKYEPNPLNTQEN